MDKKVLVTIGRQYGSGGREIGKLLAERLQIPYYDKELVVLTAEKSGLSHELLESVDEKATNPFLYSLTMGTSVRGKEVITDYNLPINDQAFIVQCQVIKEIAEKGSAVIVGRCADAVLKDDPALFSVFIYADAEHRTERIVQRHELPADKARKLMIKTDKRRRSYYNYYSDKDWGTTEGYHLCVDSGALGVENTVKLLEEYIHLR